MAFGQPEQNQQYLQYANSITKSKQTTDSGLIYNDNYAIENFLNVHLDKANQDTFQVLNDPTYFGFKIFFHFDATSGLLAAERNTNSALAYFERIGQTKRKQLLERFINVLSKVNSITPWMFQSIEGLDDIYATPFNEVYMKKPITINTLETIDGKIASLIMMYKHIVYDSERHVEVIPKNLRSFSMSVYLYDFRNFNNLSQTSVDLLQTIKNHDIKNLNHILIDLGYCEIDAFASGSSMIASANNSEYNPVTNNIKINTEKAAISGLFKSITGNTELDAEQFSMVEIGTIGETEYRPNRGISGVQQLIRDDINGLLDLDSWKTKVSDAITDIEHSYIDRIRASLTAKYLGNVHGFSLEDIYRFARDEDYRTQFNNIYSKNQGTKSLRLKAERPNYNELEDLY